MNSKNTNCFFSVVQIMSVVVLMLVAFSFAGVPSKAFASTTGSIIINYDNNGGEDTDCEALDTPSCVVWRDGLGSAAHPDPAQWEFCKTKAVQYASGLSDVSGLNVTFEQIAQRAERCMTSEANHTYVTYRISFAPKSICSCDADCGTSGFEGGNFCKDGNVYKNYRRSVCNNPGTSQSSCSSSIIPVFWYGCGYNQTCSNGYCIPKQHEEGCTCDTDCGANGFVDGNFCKDGNVYKNYKKNMCIGGSCSSALVPTLWYYCTDGQTCSSGYCHKAECANNGYGSFSCPHGS